MITPNFEWEWPHLRLIRSKLDLVTEGILKKLMIFLPPRHGKSQMVTVRYPAWRLEMNPSMRVIIGAYNQTLACKFSRGTRRLVTDRVELSSDRTAQEDWETVAGGGLRAVGVGSGITGQGGDLIVIDDPVKSREEAGSEAYRERVWNWYTDDLYTRQEPGCAIILIMTRWHEDDLAGRILASDDAPNWEVISLPALAEADDPLGRKEGEALCPERYNVAALESIKSVVGSSFQGLFQQRPAAQEGSIFKREWWRYYQELPNISNIIQSWDTGFKEKTSNDFSCCTTWGVAQNGYYLMDLWKERVQYPELKRQAKALHMKYQPGCVLIEDKASGQSLIQELKRDTRIPVIPVSKNKGDDKVSLANSCTPLIEAGKVFLPESLPWLSDYLDSMASFPYAAHDDDVDSTTQALNYFLRGGGGTGMLDFYAMLSRKQEEQKKAA